MKEFSKYLVIILAFVFIIIGCNDEEKELPITPGAGGELAKNSCEGCHTDYDLLKQVYTLLILHQQVALVVVAKLHIMNLTIELY